MHLKIGNDELLTSLAGRSALRKESLYWLVRSCVGHAAVCMFYRRELRFVAAEIRTQERPASIVIVESTTLNRIAKYI